MWEAEKYKAIFIRTILLKEIKEGPTTQATSKMLWCGLVTAGPHVKLLRLWIIKHLSHACDIYVRCTVVRVMLHVLVRTQICGQNTGLLKYSSEQILGQDVWCYKNTVTDCVQLTSCSPSQETEHILWNKSPQPLPTLSQINPNKNVTFERVLSPSIGTSNHNQSGPRSEQTEGGCTIFYVQVGFEWVPLVFEWLKTMGVIDETAVGALNWITQTLEVRQLHLSVLGMWLGRWEASSCTTLASPSEQQLKWMSASSR